MAIPGADKGVVAARIQMDILWTVVNNIHFGESGEVIVITKAGNIIAHTNSEFVLTRQTLSGALNYQRSSMRLIRYGQFI